ncbi:VOC family protein [Amylibacter sp. SFDW26]|uniref:VOC family protein n=1 Tax=Amylibacter sp. SFDW26 TaxID=2652722 RepID=UPI00186A985D|nr:VOC family protein [Amylibacter sp. SFDW26]
MSPKFLSLSLTAKSPETLAKFYVDILGFTATKHGAVIRLKYPHQETYIEFYQADDDTVYKAGPLDRYWKFGLTLPDADMAFILLKNKGVTILSEPAQRADIAYLGHILDPEGFQIELLQHTFEGEPLTTQGDKNLPLGGGASIGYVTFRTNDIESDTAYLEDDFGMTFLSKQEIPQFGFDLYFWGYTDERPPNPDLIAVENRPWLWQRPYATFEIQHWLNSDVKIAPLQNKGVGFKSVNVHADEKSDAGTVIW